MAKSPIPKPPSPVAVPAAADKTPRVAADDPAERPVFPAVLVTPAGAGKWAVVLVRIQGEDVVDREILCKPTDKAFALVQAQAEFVKHVIAPYAAGKVKA